MNFAVNAQNLIYMAVDTVNGNVNLNFLVRLLEAMSKRMQLDRYEVDFTGNDARRAQTVYSGGPDPVKYPLDSEFTFKLESEIDISSDKLSVLSFGENDDENAADGENAADEMVSVKRKIRRRNVKKNKENKEIKENKENKLHKPTTTTYQLPPYDVDYKDTKIQNDGAINLGLLKELENTIYKKPVFREDKERLSFLFEKFISKTNYKLQEDTMRAQTPSEMTPGEIPEQDKDSKTTDKDLVLAVKDISTQTDKIVHVKTEKSTNLLPAKMSSSLINRRKKSTKPKDKVPNLPTEFERTRSSDSFSIHTHSSSSSTDSSESSEYFGPYMGPKYIRNTKFNLMRKKATNKKKKVKKEVRIIEAPTQVYEPKMYAPDAFRKDENDYSNLNTDFIGIVGTRLLEIEEQCFRRKVKRSLTHDRMLQDTAIDKYILKNHEPNSLKEHIEKILSRLNKVEHQTKTLISSVKEINDCTGTLSYDETDSDCDEFGILKRKRQEPPIDVRVKKLANNYVIPSKFHSVFGGAGNINGKISVNKFKTFFNDYMEKFQIIYDYIVFNEKQVYEMKLRTETKVDIESFKLFEKIVKTTHEKTNIFIDDFLREADASGMVQFIGGGACVSCANPAKMRRAANAKQQPKGVVKPREHMAPFRPYNMSLIKKERYNVEFKDPKNVKTIACYCTVDPGRKCEQENATEKIYEDVIFTKGITSQKTTLGEWIRDNTPKIKAIKPSCIRSITKRVATANKFKVPKSFLNM